MNDQIYSELVMTYNKGMQHIVKGNYMVLNLSICICFLPPKKLRINVHSDVGKMSSGESPLGREMKIKLGVGEALVENRHFFLVMILCCVSKQE